MCVRRLVFCHLTIVWRLLAEERLAISKQSIHSRKVHFVGYNSVANNMGLSLHSSSCYCLLIREMSRNSKRIWPYSSSRSSKVIDLGVNGKPICDFILVINCNFSCICHRFRDIHAQSSWFYPPLPCLTPPLWGNPLEFLDETYITKTRGTGLLYSENCITLASTVFEIFAA